MALITKCEWADPYIAFNIIYIMRSMVWGYLFKQVSPSCRQNGKHRLRRISQKWLYSLNQALVGILDTQPATFQLCGNGKAQDNLAGHHNLHGLAEVCPGHFVELSSALVVENNP